MKCIASNSYLLMSRHMFLELVFGLEASCTSVAEEEVVLSQLTFIDLYFLLFLNQNEPLQLQNNERD